MQRRGGPPGGGIAVSLANIGMPVTLIDGSEQGLERGLSRVRGNYATTVKCGKLSQSDMDRRLALIPGSLSVTEVKDTDMVIEAVFEDLGLRQDIFRQLDAHCQPGSILATNTSGLDVDASAAVTSRPQDVVGAHFFSPAHVMKLLEVARGAQTAPDVIATLIDLGRRMGKIAVLSRIYPGFIGNALLRNCTREAPFLVEDSALPHEVDAALQKFGHATGIFAVHDMAGNGVGYQTRKAQMPTRPTDRRWNDLIMKLCDQGRLGRKSGKGWHRCEALSREAIVDNVTLHNLLPERLDTPRQAFMAQRLMQQQGIGLEAARRQITDTLPAKRLGDPADFGAACALLCGAKTGFMTGQNLQLDGGAYAGLI